MYLYHVSAELPVARADDSRAGSFVPPSNTGKASATRFPQRVVTRRGAEAVAAVWSARRRQGRALLALLVYVGAALLLAAPLPLHFTSTVARAVRQDVWLNLWALAWTSEHLVRSPAGLFDANIFFPHPHTLAYTDHFIGEALLAAPAYWISGSAVVAYNLAWYAALALTGWGGYLWVRSLIGDEPAGEAAALVAGAFCLFVPGKRTALSHLQVISLQGVTLALFATHLLLQKPRWRRALWLAGATVYAALCSWYTAAYVALILPLVGIGGARIHGGGKRGARALLLGAVALSLAALLMVPIASPFRAVQQQLGFERPVDELVETSLAPIDFVASWSWLHEGWLPSGSGAGGYFPGVLALLLVAVGVRDGRRRADGWPVFYGLAALAFALLALGPRLALGDDLSLPLPYALLYRFVPGFDALRNPYRAAFFASLLLAVPVGYGARSVIEWARGRLLVRQRWQVRPRLASLAPVTWAVALLLCAAHLLEAWPGPQEVEPLPAPPSDAYAWLAGQPQAAVLVWPLPRPFDDNARYQLWTVGGWVPLVNGHSGLYPPDFLGLYRAGTVFPEPRFTALLKELFPVTHVVAHYGLAESGDEARAAAADNAALAEVWSRGDDVIYRLANGAAAGWMRRRLPRRMVGERLIVRTAAAASGCRLRVLVDGTPAGEGGASRSGAAATSLEVDLPPISRSGDMVTLEMYLVDESGAPRFDLYSSLRPQRSARLEVNGTTMLQGPAVVGVVDAASGQVGFARAVAAETAGVGGALRQALADATPGDEILVAVAEALDYRLVERLRLLLDDAGAPASGDTLEEVATTYAFRGRLGAAPGSAREALGEDEARLLEDDPESDCRVLPLDEFEFRDGPGRR
jgi:hypothetical protein